MIAVQALLVAAMSSIFSLLPTEVSVDKQLMAPVVVNVSEFDEMAVEQFASDMDRAQSTGQDVIPIVINSYGGSVYGLLTMVDIIKASKIPVATICIGKCMSAAAVLLTCGTEGLRFATEDSTVMIHEVSSMLMGSAQSISKNAAEVDRLNKRVLTMMAKNVGKADDYFIKIIHDNGHVEWFMDSTEAKKNNIVNHIGLPTLQTKIFVKSVLKYKEEPKPNQPAPAPQSK